MNITKQQLAILGVVGICFATPALSADWSGVYGGAHVGALYGKNHAIFNGYNRGASPHISGKIGGVQVGYNHDFENFIIGIEGDVSYSDSNGSTSCPSSSWTCKANVNKMFSLRPRVGAKVGDFLVYGTAGYARAEVRVRAENWNKSIQYGTRAWHKGLTYGAGVEYLLPAEDSFSKTSIRLEYRLTSLSKGSHDVVDGTMTAAPKLRSATLGVNFHF